MIRVNNTKENKLVESIIALGCKEIINNQNVNRCFNKLRLYSDELHRHSVNVSILSVVIGINVYKDLGAIRDLFVSGLLHDYGKLYVPIRILDKSDRLTKKERIEIEKHVRLGYEHLKQEKCFSNKVLRGVLEHHERMDGTGYGKKIIEKEISEFAKIIAIADVYDAMISDRVYRSKLERGIVYEYLFSNAGTHFNRSLVKTFINNTLSMDLDYVINESERQIIGYNFLDTVKEII